MLNPLDYARNLKFRLQRKLILALGGYDPVTVGFLMYRANLLADQALSGRYKGGLWPVVQGQVRAVRAATQKLDRFYGKHQGIKRGFCRVEIVSGNGEGLPVSATCSVAKGVGGKYLLATNLGPSERFPRSRERGDMESHLERWKVSGCESI